jgi:hypothetical protein
MVSPREVKYRAELEYVALLPVREVTMLLGPVVRR